MNIATVGLEWGDEGKGSVANALAPFFDYNVRYNGGHNAGHTVVIGDKVLKFHLIPSGITEGNPCFIARGVVVNPFVLNEEIERAKENNIDMEPQRNLYVSERAHLIMPWHEIIDSIEGGKIGTTGRGIGPCYGDATLRKGVKFNHAIDRHGNIDRKAFEERVGEILEEKNKQLTRQFDHPALSKKDIVEEYLSEIESIRQYITNAAKEILGLMRDGKDGSWEGAQGGLIDNHKGTNKYVTSSVVGADGISTGTGVMVPLDRIIGVMKAYKTRVGLGPFPTELTDEKRLTREIEEFVCGREGIKRDKFAGLSAVEQSKLRLKWVPEYRLTPEEEAILDDANHPDFDYIFGKKLVINGEEFGTTTGRGRRVGWQDLVATRYIVENNGVTDIALTKQGPLDDLSRIFFCTMYDIEGGVTNEFPSRLGDLEAAVPIYEEHPGWQCPTTKIKDKKRLPDAFRAYARSIEDLVGAPITLFSTGREKEYKIIDEGLLPN